MQKDQKYAGQVGSKGLLLLLLYFEIEEMYFIICVWIPAGTFRELLVNN